GCYGYKKNTSPNIDAFAKESALFTQAIAQGSCTYLSLPSLHTSTYPRTHGVYNVGYKINPLLPTLAEVLKKSGYTTAMFGTNVKRIQGLERGFDVFKDDGDIKADKITQRVIAWLEKNRNTKFFLWIHYFEPHGPYRPPQPYNKIFLDESQTRNIPINYNSKSGFMAIPNYIAENNITNVNFYISQYDGEIRFVDEQIGILFKKIKELNLDSNTLFVITADHGEAMGERNHYFGHWSIYDEIIKVPLIIKCKKIISRPKIIDHQVQMIDIAPTILKSVGIVKPKTMKGNSLLPLILKNKSHFSVFAYSEVSQEDDKIEDCIRTKEWKLLHKRYTKRKLEDTYELYNLILDPEEKNNLVNERTNEFKFLNKKLNDWRKDNPLVKPIIADSIIAKLTQESKEILKSLGYLD
ncbi:MAG: sulfatase-like hydrolase/transferase, partial [Candidatus Omnitrophica bacterium]|nr:sulfatase-like hydrolase/transferase [Candidatus Omnitrophota bacterium]